MHRKAYRAALARGEHWVNLDGSDAGPAFARAETQLTTADYQRGREIETGVKN